MDIKELESVLAVYRHKSFSEAAYQMDFSLSAISKHVSHVEKEFGIKIFERKTKGTQMQLTDTGKIILPAIEKVVVEYGNLEWLADSCNLNGRSVLAIGYDVLFGEIGEEEIITDFYLKYPKVDINQVILYRKELIRMLLAGQLDGIFIMLREQQEGNADLWQAISDEKLQVIPTRKSEKLYMGISEKHPLADRKTLKWEELKDETFLFSSFQNPKHYSSFIYEIEKYISECGKEMKIRYVDFIQKNIVRNIVVKGLGVLPQLIPPQKTEGIVFIPMDDMEVETKGMFVCKMESKCRSLREFCRCVEEYSNKLTKNS